MRVDRVVVGCGPAGLAAALALQEQGAEVLLCEAADRLGGAALYSRGTIWAMDAALVSENHAGNRALQELVVQGTPGAREWLRERGAVFSEWVDVGYGSGQRCDIGNLVVLLGRRFAAAGGRLHTGSRVTRVDRTPGGAIAVEVPGLGVVVSEAVVLATGGFAASRELCGEFGVPWDGVQTRTHPNAAGDGLRICLAAGGSTTDGDMDVFYGHPMAVGALRATPEAWFDASQIYGHLVPVVDRDGFLIRPSNGEAFASDDLLNAVIGRSHGGVAAYLVPDAGLGAEVRRGSITIGDVLGVLTERWGAGVRVTTAGELRSGLAAAGVRAGAERVRELAALPAVSFPLTVVAVRATRTLTGGGVRVDSGMRVLDRRGNPVWGGGLRCAGADVGGINSGRYLGGLSAAFVTGLRSAGVVLGD